MINLLPEDTKNDIRAARSNVYITNYTLIILMAFILVGVAIYTSYLFMRTTMDGANQVIESNDTKAGVYSQTKNDVDTLNSQLSGVKPILDKEIRYSKILTTLGNVMPSGTVIGSFTVTDSNFLGTPLEMTVHAQTTDSAATVQSQLMSSNLFSTVSIKGSVPSQNIKNYPVTITFSVVFKKQGGQL